MSLSRELVLETAIALADEIGMESLTIRRLATTLDVGTMTVYHYVKGKDDIIDGMVDSVFGEIELPPPDEDWKTAIKLRCMSAREVLNRHPWAPPYMESRQNPGPANLRHHDAVIGCLRQGLSLQMTAHAYAILDAFIYGFALEEAYLPVVEGDMSEAAAALTDVLPADLYPFLAELTTDHVLRPGYDFGSSFEFGLDLIIEGLDRAARSEA